MRTKPLSKRIKQAGTMMLSAKTAPPRGFNLRLLMALMLALLTGQSVWADDGGSCGRSNVNGGNNVKWEYTAASGTLRIYQNTTDPSGTDFRMNNNYNSWTPAPWYNYRASITTLIVDNGVQSVGGYAMDGCTALTSENITIAASVTHISSYAFRGCTDLTTAPIGSGVTEISTYAFQNCTGLTSATIPASVTDFNCTAFDGCTSLTDITVAADNPNYKDVDGVMMSKDGTTLIRYPEGKTATSYTIPDGVTTIDTYAFKNNTHLTTVTIPEDVTTINSAAFYYCTSLASVTIPASVTEIKYRAFGYCTALTSVYLMSATLPTIENVGNQEFAEFEAINANCHFYHYGTAYNSGDWTTMWSQMASNDPAWTGTHTVIGSVALPTNVTAATAVLTYGTTKYYAEGATITLNHGAIPAGYTFGGYSVKDADNGDVTVTETSGVYTFVMPAKNVTVTATWTPVWTGSGDSAADPYIITTTDHLNLLAKMVNGLDGYDANNFSGKFFKLGNDIEYSSTTAWNNTETNNTANNFTAIGTINYRFSGTFDGDGHTISGIRITQKEKRYQGLFGYIGSGGTVKNVTLTNARVFSNKIDVGGIAGGNDGTITNCHVAANVNILGNGSYHGGIAGSSNGDITGCTSAVMLNWSGDYRGGITGQICEATVSDCLVTGVSYSFNNKTFLGAIVGKNFDGTLSNNYYRDCSVNGATTNIGVGTSTKNVSNDADGARSIHTLTLAEGVTATGETVTISSTTYYAAGSTVTLSGTGTVPTGYSFSDYSVTKDGTNPVETINVSNGQFTCPQ